MSRRERGSAAVELALVLPLVLLFSLALVQVGLIARDNAVVALAAREGSREAAVSTDDDRVREVALRSGTLVAERTDVEVDRQGSVGDAVSVRVRYEVPLVVPFIGWLFPEAVQLTGEATMRQEVASETPP